MKNQKSDEEPEQELNKTDVVCSALIDAFNKGRISIEINGDQCENMLYMKIYIDGRCVHSGGGALY